jgi:Domain of unknown function (DUF4260)
MNHMKTTLFFQRLEAASMFIATLYFYHLAHGSWLWYVPMWIAFDVTAIGYVVNARIGAYTYNVGHSFVVPSLLAIADAASPHHWLTILTLMWFAHITLDRVQGYGLKETSGFTHTHLGLIGFDRKRKAA